MLDPSLSKIIASLIIVGLVVGIVLTVRRVRVVQDICWRDFLKCFPGVELSPDQIQELLRDGFIAVGVGDGSGRVFTIRLEVAESDIPEVDFSKAEKGRFYRDAGVSRKVVPGAKG